MRGRDVIRRARALLVDPLPFLELYFGLKQSGTAEVKLTTGPRLKLRARGEMEVGDPDIFCETILEDCYRLKELKLNNSAGWVIDIGAHIGTVTCAIASLYPDMRIIAVEPDPKAAILLRHNIALNGFSNVHVIAAGICNSKVAWFHRNLFNSGGSIIRERITKNGAIPVSTLKLSQILRDFGVDRLAFLKIDCEGCEAVMLNQLLEQQIAVSACAVEVETLALLVSWEELLVNMGHIVEFKKTSAQEGDYFLLRSITLVR